VALEAEGVSVETRGVDTLVVRGITTDVIGEHAFRNDVMLHELAPYSPSLEDLFLDWTNEETTIDINTMEATTMEART